MLFTTINERNDVSINHSICKSGLAEFLYRILPRVPQTTGLNVCHKRLELGQVHFFFKRIECFTTYIKRIEINRISVTVNQ